MEYCLGPCNGSGIAKASTYTYSRLHPISVAIRARRKVLVAAHGNSLRALVKYLDGISDEEIVGLNIPTGVPLVYDLDADLRPIRHEYLGDPARVEAAMAAVAAQGKAASGN